MFGQRTQLWYDLPLRDAFEIIRDLYTMDPGTYRTRLGEFTELLDLDEFVDTPVRSLSLGQRMRGRRVVIIDHGRILYEGDVELLKAQYVTSRDIAVHCTDFDAGTISSPYAEVISADPAKATLRFDPEATAAPKVVHDLTSRYPITDLSLLEPDLEDVIRQLYTERTPAAARGTGT